jgi:hypothetical protein
VKLSVIEDVKMKWKCDCGYSRELRSDGVVVACKFCGAPEFDALAEVMGNPQDYEYEWVDLPEGDGIELPSIE